MNAETKNTAKPISSYRVHSALYNWRCRRNASTNHSNRAGEQQEDDIFHGIILLDFTAFIVNYCTKWKGNQ